MTEKKERPKTGDRVEFRCYRMTRIGIVIAVAETGVHFLIEAPIRSKMKRRHIGLDSIIRILPSIG